MNGKNRRPSRQQVQNYTEIKMYEQREEIGKRMGYAMTEYHERYIQPLMDRIDVLEQSWWKKFGGRVGAAFRKDAVAAESPSIGNTHPAVEE